MPPHISPITNATPHLHLPAAELLVRGFATNYPGAWDTLEDGQAEIAELLEEEAALLGAIDDNGRLLGWVGGLDQYDGHAWELHPLVVDPDLHGQGIGRLLVEALEKEVAARGATTIYLGTDDTTNMTSLAGKDLYPDVWEHVKRIQNLKGHPFSFYQKLGYVIVGVIPDANGFGKPDIMMAKRIIN